MKKQIFKTGIPLLLLAFATLFIGSSCGGEPSCDESIWYYDNDGDGFGDPDKTTEACNAPLGYVLYGTDCDDNNDTIYPEAEELCDGLDNNCDGEIDNSTTDCEGETICVDGACVTDPENTCNSGISYELDGNLISFDNALVTGEIHNDAAIGKFYDIWTDENGGFYYHSTITENTETAPFASDWFTTNDVANIIFLNNETNVNVTFTIEQSANAVGDEVRITFSGTYDDTSGVNHTITEGEICTTIDIVN